MPRPPLPADVAEVIETTALSKDRKRRASAVGHGTRGEPPMWLRAKALPYYERILDEMEVAGTLSLVDAKVVGLIANSELEMVEAQAVLDKEGCVVDGSQGQMRGHPMLRVREAAQVRIAKLLRELGLTPSARASLALSMSPEAAGGEDEDEEVALR